MASRLSGYNPVRGSNYNRNRSGREDSDEDCGEYDQQLFLNKESAEQYICAMYVNTKCSSLRLKTAKVPKFCERQIPEGNYSRMAFLSILSYSIQYGIYQQYIYDSK